MEVYEKRKAKIQAWTDALQGIFEARHLRKESRDGGLAHAEGQESLGG